MLGFYFFESLGSLTKGRENPLIKPFFQLRTHCESILEGVRHPREYFARCRFPYVVDDMHFKLEERKTCSKSGFSQAIMGFAGLERGFYLRG